MIGKEIRLKRLMPTEDSKYFGLTDRKSVV